MTFKVIRGQGQAEEMTSVPYRDYFLVYVTDYDLEKSFTFDNEVSVTSRVLFPIYM